VVVQVLSKFLLAIALIFIFVNLWWPKPFHEYYDCKMCFLTWEKKK